MSEHVVPKFYLLQATRSVGFVSPIFTLFLLRDLTFTQVGALSALSSLVVILGEVPTGYVGDRVGRRASIAASIALKALSLAGFLVARSFAGYAVLYVPWALGMTFASGSIDAWLYDTLDERLESEAFTRVRGRGEAVLQWTSVVTTVLGGGLYTLAPTWPFAASLALNLLGLGVVAALPANRAYRHSGATGGREGDPEAGPDGTLAVLRRAATTPSLRSFAVYTGLFLAVLSAATTYIQPIAATVVETSLPTGLPVGVSLGLLYAGFAGVSALASQWAGAVEDRLGLAAVLVVVPVGTALLLVLPRVVLLAALPMFVAMRASRALLVPMVNGHVADSVADAGRATAVSAVSLLVRCYKMPLAIGAGVVADAVGETTAVAGLAVLFLGLAGALALVGDPLPGERTGGPV